MCTCQYNKRIHTYTHTYMYITNLSFLSQGLIFTTQIVTVFIKRVGYCDLFAWEKMGVGSIRNSQCNCIMHFCFSDQCWISFADGGPTLTRSWVSVSCLLGILPFRKIATEPWRVIQLCNQVWNWFVHLFAPIRYKDRYNNYFSFIAPPNVTIEDLISL